MKGSWEDVLRLSAPTLVALILVFVTWFLASRAIATWRAERLSRLKRLETFAAVPTSSPYNNLEEKVIRDAEKNVNARFSVMRVVLTVGVIALVITVGLLPFLGELPQTLLSFLIAITIAIVGIAARPLIENFISGIVLSFSKQLKVGDTVLLDADHYGTVEDINPTHTVVKLWDWRRYVVPNSSMLQKEVVSYTHKDNFLWTHVAFHVSPRACLEKVESIAIESAKASSFTAGFEEPQFWVRELYAASTLCWIAAWAKTPEDAWHLRSEMRKQLSSRLKTAGIDTMLESHQVHLHPRE